MTVKERIAEIIWPDETRPYPESCKELAAQILSQIVEEIKKCEMTGEEIARGTGHTLGYLRHSQEYLGLLKNLLQAYRQKIINKLEE